MLGNEEKKKTGLLHKIKMVFSGKKRKELKPEKKPEIKPLPQGKHKIVTDFDSIESFVKSKTETTIVEISNELEIPKKRVLRVALVLEKAGLVKVNYPAVGSPKILFINKEGNNNSGKEKKVKKKEI
jgi:predicted transcriptional regulator